MHPLANEFYLNYIMEQKYAKSNQRAIILFGLDSTP